MTFRSIFVFENGQRWFTDWTQPLYRGDRPARLGFFTRLDLPDDRPGPASHWIGRENLLAVVRGDDDQLVDLNELFNAAPWGGPTGLVTAEIRKQAEAASRAQDPLVNVYYRPEVLRFSYTFGRRAIGPGGSDGGLRTLPERFDQTPLLTMAVPLHINTPPGASSVDAALVFYYALHVTGGRVTAEEVGSAHPWHFHGDGYGAHQDEINAGLASALRSARSSLNDLVNQRLGTLRARDVYLLPGAPLPRLELDDPMPGQAFSRMSLGLRR